MDSKLEKALDFSNFRQTLHNQQQTLFSKVEDLKLLTYRDRLIKTSEQLIALTKTMIDLEYAEFVVDDINGNPVKIDDPKDFLENIVYTYANAKNEHFQGYEKIRKARSIKKLVNFE
tara:strand:- start:66 stop:416 length:351 start_codon:yes stop_codon:yes gene_type:complete